MHVKKLLACLLAFAMLLALCACTASKPDTTLPDAAPSDTADDSGLPQLTFPYATLKDGIVYVRPGMVQVEGSDIPAFDPLEVTYEIWDLDSDKLVCTRSRSEFTLENSNELTKNEVMEGSICIDISDISQAPTCRIGVKAVAEGYADSPFMALEYITPAQRDPMNATLDGNGILRIGNYQDDCMYLVYVNGFVSIPVESQEYDMSEILSNYTYLGESCQLDIYEVSFGSLLFTEEDAKNYAFGQSYGENKESLTYTFPTE